MLEIVYDSDTHIAIRGEAVFPHVVQLYNELKPLLGKDYPVSIDLSGIQDIDLSAFQVFIALSLENGEGSVLLLNCPQHIIQRIEIAGLAEWIRVEGNNDGRR